MTARCVVGPRRSSPRHGHAIGATDGSKQSDIHCICRGRLELPGPSGRPGPEQELHLQLCGHVGQQPWDSQWKTNCRTKIKGCDGLIAIITNRSIKADGQRWEIKCANEEGVPVIGLHVQQSVHGVVPSELTGKKVIDWTWDGIKAFLDSL